MDLISQNRTDFEASGENASLVKQHLHQEEGHRSGIGHNDLLESAGILTDASDTRPHDIICGRGGASNNNIGNIPYWELILGYRESYKAANSTSKHSIALKVFNIIREGGGRFLMRDKRSQHPYVEVPEPQALEKIKRALRDDYIPLALRRNSEP